MTSHRPTGASGASGADIRAKLDHPAPEVARPAPHLAAYSMAPQSPAMDVGDRYDPVWARCVELGVAPSCHNGFRGRGSTWIFWPKCSPNMATTI